MGSRQWVGVELILVIFFFFKQGGLIKLPFSGICYVDQVNLELTNIHLPLTLGCYD